MSAMPGFLSRFTNKGGDASTVLADLKRLTDSEIIDIPQALLTPVIEAACNKDDRQSIMKHLQSCLATSWALWRRVHAGLVLAEALLEKGPQELVVEISLGLHFDLVQRLAFLENFQYVEDKRIQSSVQGKKALRPVDDKRIQSSVQKKAKALRADLLDRLQSVDDADCGSVEEMASAGAAGEVHVPVAATSSEGHEDTPSDVPVPSQALGSESPAPLPEPSKPGFFARFTSRSKTTSTVLADLQRLTDSDIIDIPPALLEPVVDAARSEDDRQEIMKHLQSCLASSGVRWRRVHAGLVLAETLLEKGSQELVVETSRGCHFDLVQRLSFLEKFSYVDDRRIQNSIRTKAKALRDDLLDRLQNVDDVCGESMKDTASTGSAGDMSALASSLAGSDEGMVSDAPVPLLGFGSDSPAPLPLSLPFGQLVLNGIVAVGHQDDTTSESSSCEEAQRPSRRGSKTKTKKATRRHSTPSERADSDVLGGTRLVAAQAPAACVLFTERTQAPVSVDLLGL